MTDDANEARGGLNLLGLPIALAVGVVGTVCLGFVYGYLTSLIPFIFINLFLAIGYGFAVGFAVGAGGLFGRIRSPGLMALLGFAVGLFAVYMAWVGWIQANVGETLWDPGLIWRNMQIWASQGIWSIGTIAPRGFALCAIWAVEAGMITILSTIQATSFVTDEFADTAK